ncbi:ABC transporter permease subunit [uncultured Roseobacter sp.]|uniref:amino acid ABC transporter permease n=1 Tax=uncultured Roseobacter sp. TaxID=114847 RepID=UPI0026290D92|nr:ABC transporter permease subunit [uncultured Roseobacter sp.]
MTTLADAPVSNTPKESFRLAMLLNDTRYRSLTFQFIALVAIIAFMAFVGGNLVRNLAEAGLNISYAFLGEPAGYDINQRPIEYDSQSSHGRAAVVGLLNTLIVAFLACMTATVIGVVAGVLRLSNNWLVSKVMSFYVEIFRNVPVLIWILIIFSIMINALPGPRDFRGDNPTASMSFFDTVAFTNRGVFGPAPQFTNSFGATADVPATSTGLDWLIVIAALMLSFFVARAIRAWATKTQEATGVRPATWHMLLATWVIPVGIVLTFLGLTWEIPALRGFNFQGGMQIRGSLIALWFALAIYTGAFIAENVRAGIMAVSKGQTEAAGALGLRPNLIMSLVVLPQALRVIIPPLISQYLNITKNSSLAIAVGYMDVTGTLGGITLLQTGRAIETILLLMLFYLTISLLISAVMNVFNNSMKLKER